MSKFREYLKSKESAIRKGVIAILVIAIMSGYYAFLGMCVYTTKADWYGLPTWVPFIILFAIFVWIDYRSFEPSGGSD